MNWKFKSYMGLGAIAFAAVAAPTAHGQVYTSSDLVAKGELGMSAGIGGWNDVAFDQQETTDIGGHSLLSTTKYTGPDPDSLGEMLDGSTSASITSILDPGNYNVSFATHANMTRTSGDNPYTNPAAQAEVGQVIDLITGPAGDWTFNATGSIIHQISGTSAFSFGGYVEDHTAGWTHNYAVASASNTFTPYSETDTIASGDWITIGLFENSYGFTNENAAMMDAQATGSISFSGPSSVPEPSSVVFLVLAGANLGIRRSRRNR